MAEDALGLRGYAQVFRPQTGNLNAIIGAAQRQKQADQEYAFKKQQADQAWFETHSKLGWADVRAELNQGMADSFSYTSKAMFDIYQKELKSNGGLSQEAKSQITKLQGIHDSYVKQFDAFDKSMDKFDEAYKANPNAWNKQVLSSKMHDWMNSSYTREEDGSISINRLAINSLGDMLNDPETWNKPYIIHEKIKALEQSQIDRQVDPNGSTLKTTFSNYFIPDTKNGGIEYDKNTGGPKLNVNVHSMNSMINDPQIRRIVETRAESLSSSNPGKYPTPIDALFDAYKSEIGPYAGVKDDVTTKSAPRAAGAGKTPKDYEYEVNHSISNSIKKRADVSGDGLSGKSSVSLMLPGFYEKPYTYKGNENQDVRGIFNGLYRDSDGRESIVVETINSGTGKPSGQTTMVPFTNIQAIRNTITDADKRNEFDAEVRKFKDAKSIDVAPDETKLTQAVTKIKNALGETGFFSGFDGSSPENAESIKTELVKLGIDRKLIDDLNIKVDRGGALSKHKITITTDNGSKSYYIGDNASEEELKNFLHDNFQNAFSLKGDDARKSPQKFDPNNPL